MVHISLPTSGRRVYLSTSLFFRNVSYVPCGTNNVSLISILQLSVEFKQTPLKRIGEECFEDCQALDCLSVDKARCLKAVIDSRRLVQWLRTPIACKQRQYDSMCQTTSYSLFVPQGHNFTKALSR